MQEQRRSLPFDATLDALGDVQRREVLTALLERDGREDSPLIAADEDLGEQFVRMYHVHLPKLEGYGIVVWDRSTHEVARGRNFEAVRPVLEALTEREDDLPRGYL